MFPVERLPPPSDLGVRLHAAALLRTSSFHESIFTTSLGMQTLLYDGHMTFPTQDLTREL